MRQSWRALLYAIVNVVLPARLVPWRTACPPLRRLSLWIGPWLARNAISKPVTQAWRDYKARTRPALQELRLSVQLTPD